jgi:hypothetical protein
LVIQHLKQRVSVTHDAHEKLGHKGFYSTGQLPRMGSSTTPEVREQSDRLTPNDREMDDVFGLAPSTSRRHGDTSATFSVDRDSKLDSSADVPPSRPFQPPNHPSNIMEPLQQYEKELTNARAKLEEKESELEAVRSFSNKEASISDRHPTYILPYSRLLCKLGRVAALAQATPVHFLALPSFLASCHNYATLFLATSPTINSFRDRDGWESRAGK